ncbi:MAG: winged helix-turn-helix transcriptional regulator [Candidatus Muiribacteriota bacterium]|jgi:DNA-binding MarR family transcriptional regulator
MFYRDEDLYFLKPSPKLRELMILNQLEKNPKTSQSALSKLLGISVSMVNKYIYVFTEEKFIEVSGDSNRHISYYLTDKGKEEKRKLLIAYMIETVKLYKDAKKEFQVKIENFKNSGVSKVVFYGAGETAEIALAAAIESGLKIIAVVDQNKEKQGKTINGILIVSPGMIRNMDYDGIIISSFGFTNEIFEKVQGLRLLGKKILKF